MAESKMEENKKLLGMNLHEILHPNIDQNVEIIRVSGGWIYTIYTEDGRLSSTFVPFNVERFE